MVAIGAITLLLGAYIGTAKDDIKKGLAGSTMSQIGYMILAAGLGPVGYVFAIFHLLTHGMFKAGLFLGAGSVMHGMHDDVNMRFALVALAFVLFEHFCGFGEGVECAVHFGPDGAVKGQRGSAGLSGVLRSHRPVVPRSSMTSSWRAMNESISASGRGGQPGTYTSTGMILSTPCRTRS